MIRFGGPVFFAGEEHDIWPADVEAWSEEVHSRGYSAVYVPLEAPADDSTVAEYRGAAALAGVRFAEVGLWRNLIAPNDTVRRENLEAAKAHLSLADEIGAAVCVTYAGTRGEGEHDPHPDNYSDDTFALIVDSVREVIDAVDPGNAKFALEMMPWCPPDGVESSIRLIEAIDRPAYAVHFDPVNVINSPRRYFNNAAVMEDLVTRLGRWISSAHVKDVILSNELNTHLSETPPGTGNLDHGAFLRALAALPQEVPVMMEHLDSEAEYAAAQTYLRGVAERSGVTVS